MLTTEKQAFLSFSSKNRLLIYTGNRRGFIVWIINLVCKTIVVTEILITILSNHWAKNSNRYAGYKDRCSVHRCLSINPDPTWLVDLICLLSIINLLMELMNISIIVYFPVWLRKVDMFLGLMFFLTCIITVCGIVFGIYITSYAYQLPMGYAYYCFMLGIIFSIIDWTFSLKRFISDLPEMISIDPDALLYHTNRVITIPENLIIISPKPIAIGTSNI